MIWLDFQTMLDLVRFFYDNLVETVIVDNKVDKVVLLFFLSVLVNISHIIATICMDV